MTAPVNDNFANATTIPDGSGTLGPYVIDDATREGSEPQPGFGAGKPFKTVWFMFVAAASGTVIFSTQGSPAGDADSGDAEALPAPFGNLDTQMAFYQQTGSGFAGLSLLSNNDDTASDPDGLWSLISGTSVTEGETYYVQVGVFDAAYIGSVILGYDIPSSETPPPPGADCPSDVEFIRAGFESAQIYPSIGAFGNYSDGYLEWYEPTHDAGELLVWIYHGTKNDVSAPAGYTEVFHGDWDNAPITPPIHGVNSTTAGPAWKRQATLIVAYRIATTMWSTPGTVVGNIGGFNYSDPFTTGTEEGHVKVWMFRHSALSDGHLLTWPSPPVIGGVITNTEYQSDLGQNGGADGGFYPEYDPHPGTVAVTDISADRPGNHIFATIVAVHGPVLAEDLSVPNNSMVLNPPQFDVGFAGSAGGAGELNQTYFTLFLSNKDYFEPDDPAFHDTFTTGTPGGSVTGHAGNDWLDGTTGVAGVDIYNWTLTGGFMMMEFVIQAETSDCFLAYWGINATTPA